MFMQPRPPPSDVTTIVYRTLPPAFSFQVVTVLHEFGHAIVGKCTGAKINAIKINDDTSGVTEMRGGNQYLTLPAGYLGTSFLGGLMVFAGFDILASKVVAVLIALTFLLTLYWARNWIARVLPVLCTALLAVLWWYKEGMYLPYAVLFLGVMCALQSLWDFQGLVMYKHPDSDATKFAELCMCCPGQVWGFIWLMIALVFMCGWAMLGVVVF